MNCAAAFADCAAVEKDWVAAAKAVVAAEVLFWGCTGLTAGLAVQLTSHVPFWAIQRLESLFFRGWEGRCWNRLRTGRHCQILWHGQCRVEDEPG